MPDNESDAYKVIRIYQYKAQDRESITIADTAIGFTASKITPTTNKDVIRQAVCTVETAQIRFTVDGTTPTVSIGHPVEAGEAFTINGYDDIVAFRAIRTGGTSGLIQVTYGT